MKNRTDWAYGCEPEFDLSCDKNEFGFMLLSHVEFYGYDYGFHPNYTPLINVGIYVCNYAIAKHSNTPLRRILVFQLVTLRHYC